MLIAAGVFSAPKIGFSIEKSGTEYKVHITGSSLGTIKSGEITCEYKSQVDIDNAFAYSPLSSIAIGASIDRANHRVKITLSATGELIVENAEILLMEFKISGLDEQSLFGVLSAAFKDPQGNVRNAEIAPVRTLPWHKVAIEKTGQPVEKCYLLNGRAIPQKKIKQLRYEMMHGDVSHRIVMRR
jgi:hypothetical protein